MPTSFDLAAFSRATPRLQIFEDLLHAGQQSDDSDVEHALDVFRRGREHVSDTTVPECGPKKSRDRPEIMPSLHSRTTDRRRITRIGLICRSGDSCRPQLIGRSFCTLRRPGHQRDTVTLTRESGDDCVRNPRAVTDDHQNAHAIHLII